MSRFVFHCQALDMLSSFPNRWPLGRSRFEAAYSRAFSEIVNFFFQLFDPLFPAALPQEARIIGGPILPSIIS